MGFMGIFYKGRRGLIKQEIRDIFSTNQQGILMERKIIDRKF
ncbi:hypothetical protein HMPREF1986_00091 [Oribacterium sp. oral taxon 078 str. F0263]|nr:hypothetical protein GCWU000341_00924 [Oribacterium sp. oral taxon 078 str. F0262]ERL23006.1 hypothetical protein HMPREF1986_00091 [Oribacterium sp. oral taxon 078 str. F0263]